jgi:hypothetical protein
MVARDAQFLLPGKANVDAKRTCSHVSGMVPTLILVDQREPLGSYSAK